MLFTLNAFSQDSTSTENSSDLLANKVITLIEEAHNKIASTNLDISDFKLDIDLKKITKSEIITISTIKKKYISKIKAKLVGYAS